MYLDLIYVFICNLSIYILCLSVCLFVSNKHQHGWTDQAHILCGTLHDPREGLWMIKISKISLQQSSIFIKFKKSTKFLLLFFWNVYKEKIIPIEIEDGRAVAWKPSL